MFDEHRLGNDGTEATLPRPPDDGDPEAVTIKRTKTMTTSRDSGIASSPEKTPVLAQSVIRHGQAGR